MVDFLKIDLENYSQPADVRLHDSTEDGEIHITQARFTTSTVYIERLSSGNESKLWSIDANEMTALCEAWQEYNNRIEHHAEEQKARKQKVIEEAKQLAASVHFDLESLNVRVYEEGYYWHVACPAMAFERRCAIDHPLALPGLVQEALTTLKDRVAYAERNGWQGHGQWKAIIESYRSVFPLEPAEIIEARKLLTEAGIENWSIEREPFSKWSFYGPFGDGGEVNMFGEIPTLLLTHIKEYLERKESDVILDAMDRESGIY